MPRELFNVLIGLFLLLGAVMLQRAGFMLGSIQPNLFLSTLVVIGFFITETRLYFTLLLIGMWSLRFMGFFSYESVVWLLLGTALFYLRKTRFEPRGFVAASFSFVGTYLFYLLLDPSFYTEAFSRVMLESVYNGVIALIIFALFHILRGEKRSITI